MPQGFPNPKGEDHRKYCQQCGAWFEQVYPERCVGSEKKGSQVPEKVTFAL